MVTNFILMSDNEIKERHVIEEIKHTKPVGIPFNLGDYVSIDRQTMTVYNHLSPRFRFENLYGFVSYGETTNNEFRDHINIVRFRKKEE